MQTAAGAAAAPGATAGKPVLLEEWILDRYCAEFSTVLQVLTEQHSALRISSGGNDESVIEGKRVIARQLRLRMPRMSPAG